jgi:hypothetical protein
MRLLAFAILLSVACKSGGDEPPGTGPNGGSDADRAGHDSPSEDRDQPAVKPAVLTLQVQIDGATSTWGREAFERVPRLTGRNRSGESRDAWSLRAMAAEMVGPGARVTSVTGDGASREISAEEWKDTTRTPILHTTRRGTLKFRWVEGDGEWQEEAAVRDVTGLAVTGR